MADNMAMPRSETEQDSSVGLIRVDRMYESLRYNDYSAENGLGEIVDNSVEAGAAHIAVELRSEKVRRPEKKRAAQEVAEIVVVDDGCGMNPDTLHRCLALGESIRTARNGRHGIGRFGVGMTLGGISLARRIEVYSRTRGDEKFLFTFIDLDEIRQGNLIEIPVPSEQAPPEAYAQLLKNSSGTIVILKKCDRIEKTPEALPYYLGRTYRKFIERGLTITLNGEPVFLHDPLYMAGPTVFDDQRLKSEGVPDLKARPYGEEVRIPLDIPGSDGETADVIIRMSLLPKEWRTQAGQGGGDEARKRKIDQNEGVSILRAGREVLYAHVPYITGKKGEAQSLNIDRWWGCEISFPPELDSYFQVRYIKRGAEPVASLRDKIREIIHRWVETARAEIQEDWKKTKITKAAQKGVFEKAEEAMAKAADNLPMSRKGKNVPAAENEKQMELLTSAVLGPDKDNPEKRAQKKAELQGKPYSIEPVAYPETILFEPAYLPNNTVIKLNINHPFYEKVLQPLCGGIGEDGEEKAAEYLRRQAIKDALLLLLSSYAKAEAMFENDAVLFRNLRSYWGTALATVLSEYDWEAQA